MLRKGLVTPAALRRSIYLARKYLPQESMKDMENSDSVFFPAFFCTELSKEQAYQTYCYHRRVDLYRTYL